MSDGTFYRLDRLDRIVEVGGAWDNFALANGGEELISGQIEGQPLLRFVTGDSTRMFVSVLLDSVRLVRRPRTCDYRCDGPDLKRFMRMTITPEANGHLQVGHRLLGVEPIVPRVAFRAATLGRAGQKLLFRCSFCNRVSRTVDWREVDEAMVSRAAGNGGPVAVAYTVCPDCRTMAPLRGAYLATVDGEPA